MLLLSLSCVALLFPSTDAVRFLTPLHLRGLPKSTLTKRDTVSPTQKQDNVFFSPSYKSASFQASIASAVAQNRQYEAAAVEGGKAGPRAYYAEHDDSMGAEGKMAGREKRDANGSTMAMPLRWDFAASKIRGVNLGGWLVLEPWITPSVFEATGNTAVVDEWTYTNFLGYKEAYSRLSAHWATWITEADVAKIASYGAFDISNGEPYVQGQYPWLIAAIGWCGAHGIKVIVDLHGVPGSQNGYDNSGLRGPVLWHTNTTNVNRSGAIIQTLSSEFSKTQYGSTVIAIEVLNEPAGYLSSDLLKVYKQFAYDGYGMVRYPSGPTMSGVALSLHDAFQPLDSWRGFMPSPQFSGVTLDTHVYTVFTNENIVLDRVNRIKAICNMQGYLSSSQSNLWTFVGEWSTAPTDCAGSLNATSGRGVGSRYDGSFPGSSAVGSCTGLTGSGSTFSEDYKVFLRKFWEVQTTVYESATSGYVMWAWKAENADDWSYQAGVQYGWIPSDPTQKMYGNQC